MSSFYERNKIGVIAATAVGLGALVSVVYYLSKQQGSSNKSGSQGGNESTSSKKKNKKKKKKSNSGGSLTNSENSIPLYPINEKGLPDFNESDVKNLSSDEKEKWALSLKEKGNEHFKDQDYKTAIIYYSRALDCKKDHIFYGNRSACYNALEDYEKTVEDTTKALKIEPSYIKCLFRRANAYEALGKYEEALFDITAMTIYGGMADNSNEKMLERVLKKLSSELDEDIYSKLPKELPSASSMSSFFGAFVKEDNSLNSDDYPEGSGEKYLIEGLKELSKDTQEGYEKSDILINQSIAQFEKSTEGIDPKIVSMAYEYGGAFQFLKVEIENASLLIKKALSIFPRPKQHVILGLIEADQGDYVKSQNQFDQAIEMDPKDPNIYYHYGQIFYLMGALQKAEEQFEKAKDLNPDNVYAHIQLACIVYRHGDFKKCEEMFLAAKSKFPTSPEVPNYYGEILFDRKDYVGAAKQFDTAARLQEVLPTFNIGALPLVNKSVINQLNHDIQGTIELLSKACKIDPKSEVARLNLGQTYLSLGQIEPAIEMLEQACNLSRTGEERKQAISLLEASKMQLKVRDDPILSKKVTELMAAAGYR